MTDLIETMARAIYHEAYVDEIKGCLSNDLECARAALAAIEAAGYRVVPVEPTEMMVDAGGKVEVGHSWGAARTPGGMGEYCYMPENVYAAMLAAAPKVTE